MESAISCVSPGDVAPPTRPSPTARVNPTVRQPIRTLGYVVDPLHPEKRVGRRVACAHCMGVISLTEANRLLIAAQQDLLDADQSTHEAAGRYRAVAMVQEKQYLHAPLEELAILI
jgi:hypothetical protein